ncbi:hypothetical protein LTR53_014513, partial [Teratosphaeriaceae sp. CCFEE 6253]
MRGRAHGETLVEQTKTRWSRTQIVLEPPVSVPVIFTLLTYTTDPEDLVDTHDASQDHARGRAEGRLQGTVPARPASFQLGDSMLMQAIKVAVEDRPYPQLREPTDAILKVTSTALCGSDLHFYRGHL